MCPASTIFEYQLAAAEKLLALFSTQLQGICGRFVYICRPHPGRMLGQGTQDGFNELVVSR